MNVSMADVFYSIPSDWCPGHIQVKTDIDSEDFIPAILAMKQRKCIHLYKK